MAKLDIDEDEGENGKEEHQVPHLGETYAVFVLLSKRSIMKTLISLKMRLLVDKVPTTGGGVLCSKSASCNRSSQLCSDKSISKLGNSKDYLKR